VPSANTCRNRKKCFIT